jgi:hypothetical protein
MNFIYSRTFAKWVLRPLWWISAIPLLFMFLYTGGGWHNGYAWAILAITAFIVFVLFKGRGHAA